MRIKTFSYFLTEQVDEGGTNNPSLESIQSDLSEMIEKSLKSSDSKTKEEFISAYLRDQEKNQIEGFINDSDIYEFYLKYRNAVDDILSKSNFFEEKPSDLESFSLYDYIIVGTKKAVLEVLKSMSK